MSGYDGSSLAGWTLSSASGARVDATQGNPTPSFFVNGGQYARIEFPDMQIGLTEVRFDIRIPPGSAPLANFAVFCSAAGNGTLIHIETRTGSGLSNGLEDIASWTSWTGVRAPFVAQESRAQTATWYRYVVSTRLLGSQAQLRVVRIDLLTFVEVLCLDWTNFTPQGTWFAMHGDAASTTGANFDNVTIANPVPVSGVAKLASGAAASQVALLDASSFGLIKKVTPAADGSYTVTVPFGTYIALAVGPDGYRPAAHMVTVS